MFYLQTNKIVLLLFIINTVNADTIDVNSSKGIITGIGVPVTGLEGAKDIPV